MTDHGVDRVEHPVNHPVTLVPGHHRAVCRCGIAFTRRALPVAIAAVEQHVKRCKAGEETAPCPRP